MADGFTTKLESYSRRIRRWATRRHIEMDGYNCGTWYGSNESADKILTLERYLGGPGSVPDPRQDLTDDPDNNYEYFAPFEGEVWNHIHDGEFDWIDGYIMRFGQANVAALRDLIETIKPVPAYLRGADHWRDDAGLTSLEHFTGTGGDLASGFGDGAKPGEILLDSAMQELAYWTGETATQYTRTFGENGGDWADIAYNNYALAEHLLASAEAQLAVFITARESVENICDKTIEALWAANESEGGKLSTSLSIIAAVTALTLTLATGGAAAPALIGAGFAITNAVVSASEAGSGDINSGAPGEEFDINGSTAMAVTQSMAGKLLTVTTTGAEKEAEIQAALEAAVGAVTQSAGTRSTFEITFPSDAPMDDMGEREVSMTTGDLEHAAVTLFPRSSERVLGASELLAATSGEASAFTSEFDDEATDVAAPWAELRNLLQDLTAANGEKIQYAGDFLLGYAVEMGVVDSINEEQIKRLDDALKDLPA